MIVSTIPVIPEQHYFVYALFCQDSPSDPGYVKFGFSGNIGNRITDLKTSSPVPLRYLCLVNAGKQSRAMRVEKALHEKFDGRRMHGEWFSFDFSSKHDKAAFNKGCSEVFAWHLVDREERWWTKINLEGYFASKYERAAESLKGNTNRQRRKKTHEAIRIRAEDRAAKKQAAVAERERIWDKIYAGKR